MKCDHPIDKIEQVSIYMLKCACCGKSWHAPDIGFLVGKIQELSSRVAALEVIVKKKKDKKNGKPNIQQKKADGAVEGGELQTPTKHAGEAVRAGTEPPNNV